MSNINNPHLERQIQPRTGIAILLLTLAISLTVGIVGGLCGSSYESSCTAKPGEEPICTTRYAYKGLGNLDISMPSLQALAAAIGVGFGIYSGFKNGKIPSRIQELMTEEATGTTNDTPGAG